MTTSTPAPPSQRGRAPAATTEPSHAQPTRLLHRLHFFAGVICAPLILIAAVTGLLYAVAPTAEQVVNHDMLTASIPDGGAEEHRLPLSQQVITAQQHHPDLTLSGVRLGDDDETTRVLFADPSLPESTVRAVFVNPYTGEITGDTTQYGSAASLPLRQWISEGHRSLWLGTIGRLYSETAASWLGVLAVGGLVLLWNRQKGSLTPRQRLRGMLRTGGRGRVRTARRHGTTGTIVAVGLIFLTITGLTWSSVSGKTIGEWRNSLGWATPSISSTLPDAPGDKDADVQRSESEAHSEHAGHTGHEGHSTQAASSESGRISGLNNGSIDRVSATAREELRTPVTITPPSVEGQIWTATENRAPYRLSTDSVAIDWATGKVVDRLDFSSWPLAAQATAWLIQLHMGTLFGLPNQIVLALLAAAIIALICWGYVMWWRRRPPGGLAAPPRRSGWSRPTAGTMILGIALVVYGCVAPLFGITCLAFILCSSLWSLWLLRQQRSPRRMDPATQHAPETTELT